MITDCYCTQFRRAANALTNVYDEALYPAGMKITQFTLLRSLERLGPATHTEIAAETALDKTTISRNLKVLINYAWVVVGEGEDARFKVVRLTAKGIKALRNAESYWAAAQKRVENEVQHFLKAPINLQLLRALESLQRADQL
jgi:DNA-binding MarR family transcriptional regulator